MDLPKDLEERIVTTPADVYMRHYGLTSEGYDLKAIHVTSEARLSPSDNLYQEMARIMGKRKIVAVTDVRITEFGTKRAELGGISMGHVTDGTMYGTAIVKRKTLRV